MAAEIEMANGCPRPLGSMDPRGDIGIVVEIGDDDFITRGQCGDDCIGGMESQRGHILTKNDSVGCIYP